MKLPGSNKNKITKDETGANVAHLEIAEVVLVHCNIVSKEHQQESRVLYTFFPDKSCGQLLDISPQKLYFKNFWFRVFIYWSMVYWSKF